MVPSASHPDLSVAMEAPLEMPSLDERRWRCQLPYPRWVWLALTMILTLAITLIVLYYVGALSGNRPPSSNPPVQYKHPREPHPVASDAKAAADRRSPTDRQRAPSSPGAAFVDVDDDDNDDDDDDDDDNGAIAFVLDIESPMNRAPTPRSAANSSPKLSTRNGKRGASLPSAILHFRVDLGLFDGINFSDLPIQTSFCVVASRSFTPDFQRMIPKIDAEMLATGHMLTIYTNRDFLRDHPDALRLYYGVTSDESPDAVKADFWALLNQFGPDLRGIIMFVRSPGFLSPALQSLFAHDLAQVLPSTPLMEKTAIAADLIFVSTPANDRRPLRIPPRPFFGNLGALVDMQVALLSTIDEAWCRFLLLWAQVFALAPTDDADALETEVLQRMQDSTDMKHVTLHPIVPKMREVFERNVQVPLEELPQSIDATDRSLRSFAMEIGDKYSPTDSFSSILAQSEPGSVQYQAILMVIVLHAVRATERARLRKLEWLQASVTDAGIL